ncbi:MAG: M1 family metallopeptidase [Gemmatimonadaceae bacterium]
MTRPIHALDSPFVRTAAAATILLLCAAAPLYAQTQPSPAIDPPSATATRPIPGPVYEIPEYSRAVTNGTRSRDGRPGTKYWVNRASYSIDATLDDARHRVIAHEVVLYRNNSPDTLRRVAVHLRQNAFVAGNARNQPAPVTNGMLLSRVAVNGQQVIARSNGPAALPITSVGKRRVSTETGYIIDGTVMWLQLAAPILPGESARLEFAWSYEPPLSPSDGRQGREEQLYMAGYWYPQVAVYDDVTGWVADQYTLGAEFYMDHADYDVRLTVPHGWVIGATGTLQNASEVLSASARSRLADARRTGAVIHVVEPGKGAASAFTGKGTTATWHFVASDVRDFFWGTSNRYVWDATRALVARDGAPAGGAPAGGAPAGGAPDTVDIFSFYRRSAAAAAWPLGGARLTRDAIEQLSKYLWKYPWPVMSSMEGVLESGGMEYPMVTTMQPWADTLSLAGDLMHETGHMWFPMQVGSNETRYPWMDEGFTQFDVAQAMRPLYGEPRAGGRPGDSEPGQRELYLRVARSGRDMTLMWNGDLYPPNLYFIMFYDKTAAALAALRGVIGEETFHRAYREYGRRWTGKHPYPYDFFNTVNDVAGQDLSWFWQSWFYQPWPLDQAVASVQAAGDSTAITIEDRGLAPMPVRLTVTRSDGTKQQLMLPVTVWLGGSRRQVVRVASRPAVTRVEIDPEGFFPDMNRQNQLWENSK